MPPKLPSLFFAGNYFGSHFNHDHYEILTVQHIPRKERDAESALMDKKWFDYRLMHPMQATYYLVHLYRGAYKDFVRRSMNFEAAPYSQAIKERDFVLAREKLSFWRLRRTIDQLGMRYDFFLRFAMSYLHKMIANGKVYPPRPSMLMKEELLGEALVAWQDMCDSSMQYAQSPSFRVSEFCQCLRADQRAHEQFVIGQIQKRRVPRFGLHAAIYLYDVVSVEAALQAFDPGVVEGALAEVTYLPDDK